MKDELKDIALLMLVVAFAIFAVKQYRDALANAIVDGLVEGHKQGLTEAFDRAFEKLDAQLAAEHEERWRAWHEEMDAKYGLKQAETVGGAE